MYGYGLHLKGRKNPTGLPVGHSQLKDHEYVPQCVIAAILYCCGSQYIVRKESELNGGYCDIILTPSLDSFAELPGLPKNHGESEMKILLTAGAGAGLAAVFNAPLAGLIFCIEELRKKFTPEVLIATVTATISASAMTDFVFGIRPIFATIAPTFSEFPGITNISAYEVFFGIYSDRLKIFLFAIIAGISAGFFGALTTKTLIFSLDFYERLKIRNFFKFLIPLSLVIPVGIFLPQISGCGNVLVDDLLNGNFGLKFLILLFAGKFLFTMICFGTNAPGGLFLPVLALGAIFGNIFGSLCVAGNFFPENQITLFIIFGMTAYFSAVMKAPITGSVLMMELTGQFSILLTLTAVSGAAFFSSDLCGGKPVFSALLNRKNKFPAN